MVADEGRQLQRGRGAAFIERIGAEQPGQFVGRRVLRDNVPHRPEEAEIEHAGQLVDARVHRGVRRIHVVHRDFAEDVEMRDPYLASA